MAADPVPAFTTKTDQLRAAGRRVRDAHEEYETALVDRDRLALEAATEGMPQRAIANALGITHQRVGRLMLPRAERTA